MRRYLRYATVLVAGLFVTDAAFGFYFAGWPGDGRPRRHNLVSPDASILENPPSARQDIEQYHEGPRWERQPDEHDDDFHNDQDHPSNPTAPSDTPEPATLVSAAIGVAIVGLVARRRRTGHGSGSHLAEQNP